jgi:hypothetical protein
MNLSAEELFILGSVKIDSSPEELNQLDVLIPLIKYLTLPNNNELRIDIGS